ncbi:MAG: glycosyltransferase family 4 protein [Rhodobacteraceae bacterium]|nr:glycosyltransferase family 4 protein [Paracoccaceae bacterium]
MSKTHADQSALQDLNIVHVVRQYAPLVGGLEDFVRNLVRHQRDVFKSVRVITLNRSFRDPELELSEHEEIDGVEVVRLPFFGSTKYPITPAILSELAGADLVHVHAVDFFFDALAATRIFHRKTIVATTHGGFFHTAAHSRLKRVWFNTLTRVSANQYAGLACCSQSDFDLFHQIAPSKCRLIENGVDLAKFADSAATTPQKTMVTVGRFSANKRLDHALDALKALHLKDPEWRLEIVGLPSDLSLEDVNVLARARGVESRVGIHVGPSESEIADLFRTCSIFISASEYEGFGIALIEAMSAGLKPVVHANSAYKSLAVQHEQIQLADFSNAEDVASLIVDAFNQIKINKSIRSSLTTAAEKYSWPSVAKRYEAFYQDSLSSRL